MSLSRQQAGERGFTLVEVLVAIAILLVGVLGVVSLVDGANAVTSKTKAREGGTNLARSIIEVARSVRYRDLTTASLTDALAARPPLADSKPSTAGYTILDRGVQYTLTLSVCSLDDPKDYLGDHANGVAFCSDTDALAAGQPAVDRNPDDYKRVRVTITRSVDGGAQRLYGTIRWTADGARPASPHSHSAVHRAASACGPTDSTAGIAAPFGDPSAPGKATTPRAARRSAPVPTRS
jgi:prepilin-type N-terminal cleavage/methylation domain-containing protein